MPATYIRERRVVYRGHGSSSSAVPTSDLFQYFNGEMIESSVPAIAFSQLTIDTPGNFIEANFAIVPDLSVPYNKSPRSRRPSSAATNSYVSRRPLNHRDLARWPILTRLFTAPTREKGKEKEVGRDVITFSSPYPRVSFVSLVPLTLCRKYRVSAGREAGTARETAKREKREASRRATVRTWIIQLKFIKQPRVR